METAVADNGAAPDIQPISVEELFRVHTLEIPPSVVERLRDHPHAIRFTLGETEYTALLCVLTSDIADHLGFKLSDSLLQYQILMGRSDVFTRLLFCCMYPFHPDLTLGDVRGMVTPQLTQELLPKLQGDIGDLMQRMKDITQMVRQVAPPKEAAEDEADEARDP